MRATFAEGLIRHAGKLTQNEFFHSRSKNIDEKPIGFFDKTDIAVEKLIRSALLEKFPDDSFYGKETGGTGDENYWVVDPIDGTANFTRQIPHYCITIAFVSNNKIELGLIFNPPFGELYVLRKGA